MAKKKKKKKISKNNQSARIFHRILTDWPINAQGKKMKNKIKKKMKKKTSKDLL